MAITAFRIHSTQKKIARGFPFIPNTVRFSDGKGGDFWIWRVQLFNTSCDAEIYHKDDQKAHSSRKHTHPGFSELLGTSLGMPLIVRGNY